MESSTKALSFVKTPHLREVSFSSYLNLSEEVYLRKLVETSKIAKSTISLQKENAYIGKKKAQDEEIGVFGAEKYFNEEAINHQDMKIQQLNLSPSIVKIQSRTPSVHSESSWNSQSALLQSGPKNSIHSKTAKRRQGKNLLWALSCNCSCGDTKSVDIGDRQTGSSSKRNEEVNLSQTNKALINNRIVEDMQCFTFPVKYSKTANLESKLVFQEEGDEKKRKSIEILFRSSILEKRNESIHLEKNQDVFTLEDDFESDTSSDLFEIESFSNNNILNPHLLRQVSNVSSCVTPTTCYAPSEASIEWSVVTESAADFSFANDREYTKSSFKSVKNGPMTTSDGKGKEVEKLRMGILSGCKSEKSVRVSTDAYRTNKKVISTSLPRSNPDRASRSSID